MGQIAQAHADLDAMPRSCLGQRVPSLSGQFLCPGVLTVNVQRPPGMVLMATFRRA